MKKIIQHIITIITLLLVLSESISAQVPTVTTTAATSITSTTAVSGGNVTARGGSSVTARGVCWATTANPTTASSKTSNGTGTGSFTSNLTGLTAGNTYYIRAYATNSSGTAYGSDLTFATLAVVPTLTTTAVSGITATTASSGGNITSNGGAVVTARGVCWATTANPTTSNNKTSDGTGTGTFTSSLTGLTANTTYYVRAYATNSIGTAYGSQVTFKTSQIVVPTLSTTAASSITSTTAVSGGNITSDGGASVTARGVCWAITANPTTSNSKTSDGTGTGSFTSNLTGLIAGTTYHIRAYATNSAGTAYGNDQTFITAVVVPTVTTTSVTAITQITAASGGSVTATGGATVTAVGVCWGTSTGPVVTGLHTSDGSGVGSFTSSITGLTAGTTYYVRAYATNSVGTAYGNELSFTTSPVTLATISTSTVSSTEATTAVSGGNVTSDGGGTITARGVCWATTSNPTTTDSNTSDGTGSGAFTINITGLQAGTIYYVRAYATNSAGTAYGSQQNFSTGAAISPIIFNPDLTYGTVSDIEGNVYKTIQIGTQTWMAENLKTTEYNDGTAIPLETDQTTWLALTTPAYCWYNNDEVNKTPYGALYNWYAVDAISNNNKNVCPTDWHISTLTDFNSIVATYGVQAAIAMKEAGFEHWTDDSLYPLATNASGFTALPGGHLTSDGFDGMSTSAYWWLPNTISAYPGAASTRWIVDVTLHSDYMPKSEGSSVRCIKDISPLVVTNVNDDGIGSLRNAIGYANSTIGVKDTIKFYIPGTGSFTIQPITALPSITDPVVIDGYTQPGASASKSVLMIELDGTDAGSASDGFTIIGGNSIIRGLAINRFGHSGIALTSNGKNIISGNYIGTDINGTQSLGSMSEGISISNGSSENKIGGTTLAERNIISGNGDGIAIIGGGGNSITGNYIGTDVSGKLSLGNTGNGINITGSDNNIIGGANPGERNVISGNYGGGGTGVTISNGSLGNTIKGNYIGLDVSGKLGLGNAGGGVMIMSASKNIVGGANPGEGNVISGNGIAGISIDSIGSNSNKIIGNYLGTNYNGVDSIANQSGIDIYGGATGNHIGGSTIDSMNIIANSRDEGIKISDYNTLNNEILINSIYSNVGLGIDLIGTGGPDTNDTGDGDTGPNNLQNYPVLDSANLEIAQGIVIIGGSLNSAANSTFKIQFFANNVADPSGYGEGRNYLGSTNLTTGADGNVGFSDTLSINSSWGDVFTATATDSAGNTSEFSQAIGGPSTQTIGNWPLHFVVNKDGVPNITDGSAIAAVDSAFQTWSYVPTANITFHYDGTTQARYANASDGINLISFKDDQFPFSKGVLAVTAKTVKLDSLGHDAQIIDADIVVNPEFVNDPKFNFGVGYNNKDAGYYDIQSIITHEVGHLIGLLHSGVVNSTMFFKIDSGIKVRSLEQDDKSWASYGYPTQPAYNTAYGSISGTITYGYGGQPVAGALVLAINVATNDTVHTYSDANGYYLVPGLAAGNYKVYIEPLDGSIYGLRPGNISLYLYSNTVYTDYPDEYYNYQDSNNEDNNLFTLVTVSAGSNMGHIDLVTNQDKTPPYVVSVSPSDGSTGFDIVKDITVKFSEPVDETTLTSDSFYLESNGVQYGGSYTAIGNGTNIWLFVPNSAMQYNTTYTLHITEGVTDLKGNPLSPEWTSTFTTISGNTVPPSIIETVPSSGSSGVYVTDKIMVFFSGPMDEASVENGFTLSSTNISGVQNVDGSFVWDNQYSTVTFVPFTSLKEGTNYNILVQKSAEDLSGNTLTGTNSFSFTTVLSAPPDTTYIGPRNNATSVPVTTSVVVDFTEPINTSTINSSTFSLTYAGGTVSGKFEFMNDNSRVIFRPAANLNFGTQYLITLSIGIEDVSDPSLNMSASITTTFTTSSTITTPDISYIDASSGVAESLVTIAGVGFDPNPANNVVYFNNANAAIMSSSLNSIVAKVPLGALSGPVSVTVNGVASDNTMYFYVVPQSLDPCSQILSNNTLGSKTSGGSAVRSDGAYAYVTRPDNNTVSIVDMLSSNPGVVASIPVGTTPTKIDINAEGTLAYVTNFNSHNVSVIDLLTNTEICKINVGLEPDGVVCTPDGKRVYVGNYYSKTLSVIDVDPNSGGFNQVVSNIITGSMSQQLAVTSDGAMVLVAGDLGLTIVDSNPKDASYNSIVANVSTGSNTNGVAPTSDAALAIVTTEDGNLLVVNLRPGNNDYSDAVLVNNTVGAKKGGGLGVSGDAAFVYVTDPDNDQILVYQLGYGGNGSGGTSSSAAGVTLTLHNKIAVGDAPEGLIISPNSDKIYTVDGNLTTGIRQVTTIKICCGPVTPAKSIGDLIIAVQNMINYGSITKIRGNALILLLNSALNNANAGRSKLAIADLTAFNVLVKTYVKNGQISTSQGTALVNSASVIITQFKSTKSDDNIPEITSAENQPEQTQSAVSGLGLLMPNPFSESIMVNYEIAGIGSSADKVVIKVYDIIGRLVSILVNETQQEGHYSVTWDGHYFNGYRAQFGTYFVTFQAGKVTQVKQIMLVR